MRSTRLGLVTVFATATAVAFGCGKKSAPAPVPPGPPGSLDGSFGTGGSVETAGYQWSVSRVWP